MVQLEPGATALFEQVSLTIAKGAPTVAVPAFREPVPEFVTALLDIYMYIVRPALFKYNTAKFPTTADVHKDLDHPDNPIFFAVVGPTKYDKTRYYSPLRTHAALLCLVPEGS